VIPAWAAFLTCGVFVLLGVGLYLLAWHRGYVAGRAVRIEEIPGNPWAPPSEAEFMELLERERRQPDEPRKYRREP
jgi:hypothetical protein